MVRIASSFRYRHTEEVEDWVTGDLMQYAHYIDIEVHHDLAQSRYEIWMDGYMTPLVYLREMPTEDEVYAIVSPYLPE